MLLTPVYHLRAAALMMMFFPPGTLRVAATESFGVTDDRVLKSPVTVTPILTPRQMALRPVPLPRHRPHRFRG